jgi:hypothetical protein
MIPAGGDKRGAWPAGCERKTQDTTVKIERALQIGDFQVDMADPNPRVDGGHSQHIFLEGFRLRHRVLILAIGAFYAHM